MVPKAGLENFTRIRQLADYVSQNIRYLQVVHGVTTVQDVKKV
ncbi:MAG: hypothetical protein H6Q94_907, partial [Nitrospirae bacterium]|nr:hypothetical protein [Nitrospirota bacterium]